MQAIITQRRLLGWHSVFSYKKRNLLFNIPYVFQDTTLTLHNVLLKYTAQNMKFSIKDFFSKCDQICRKLRIWSHLLKKSLTETLIFWPRENFLP